MNSSRHHVRCVLVVSIGFGTLLCPAVHRHGNALGKRAPAVASEKSFYDRVSSAVVAITCRQGNVYHYGSGVLIDPSGLILTSATVVPRRALDLRIYLAGGRQSRGTVLFTSADEEVALVRLQKIDRLVEDVTAGLPHLKMGDSCAVRLGDPVFTLGNSFRSIETDDQVCLAAGVVSGLFRLDDNLSQSKYVGPAIETSAALNNGVDGGPLVNERGEIVGLLSLNYSRVRWLGTAVPINELKPLISRYRGWFDDRYVSMRNRTMRRKPNGAKPNGAKPNGAKPNGAKPNGAGPRCHRSYAGLELEEVSGREIRVLRLDGKGPAFTAGLEVGDRITAFNSETLGSMEHFHRLFRHTQPADKVRLTVERDGNSRGAPREIELLLWGRY